jgi:hypothetical protein
VADCFCAAILHQGLVQQCVPILLTGGGLPNGLLCGGELRVELGAIAAIGLPGYEYGDGQKDWDENLCEF